MNLGRALIIAQMNLLTLQKMLLGIRLDYMAILYSE